MLLERIKGLCKERNIALRKLEQEIGVSNGAISKWNKSSPSIETLNKVADYFGVSTDYLLGKTDQKEKAPANAEAEDTKITDETLKFALWGDASNIDDADLEDVRRYAAFIAERKNNKK